MADFLDTLGGIAGDVIPFAGPAVSLLSGLFGKSPESQYQEAQQSNLRRTIDAIRTNANIRRARAQRDANRNISLATQSGSRQASFLGGTQDPSIFTDPNVSRIHSSLNESLTGIGEAEQSDIAGANSGLRDLPSYSFPHPVDYISTALGTASKYLSDKELQDYQRKMEQSRLDAQNSLTRALSGRADYSNFNYLDYPGGH